MGQPLLLEEKEVNLNRKRKRNLWFFLKGLERWPHPFLLLFFKGWGMATSMLTSLYQEKLSGMATSTLHILLEIVGGRATFLVMSFSRKRKREGRPPPFLLFFLLGDGA